MDVKCDKDECAICYEELIPSLDNPIETLTCGHKFHYDCIFHIFKEKSLLLSLKYCLILKIL